MNLSITLFVREAGMKVLVEEETAVCRTNDNDEELLKTLDRRRMLLRLLLSRDCRRGETAEAPTVADEDLRKIEMAMDKIISKDFPVTREGGSKMYNSTEDFWLQALASIGSDVGYSSRIANISLWKTQGHIGAQSKTAHGRCGATGMALKRGDIVFWCMKKFTGLRRLVRLRQWGDCVTHVTIACGDGDKVFAATPYPQRASGYRTGVVIAELDPDVATYHVFRHVNQEAAALLAGIAEGYVALHDQLDDEFGRFSHRKIVETFVRGAHGGQPKQWGEVSSSIPTDPVFYCSSYVIRVLLAAQQTVSDGPCSPSAVEQTTISEEEVSFVDKPNKLPVYSAPAQLHTCLNYDGNWEQVHKDALYRELCS